MSDSEARRLRIVDQGRIDEETRTPPPPVGGAPSVACRTATATTYPTTAARFYYCLPLTVLGTETEGTAGTLTAAAAGFYALNLGTSIPPAGTDVAVTFVDNRWVFRYG